jgi:hypothetical protein
MLLSRRRCCFPRTARTLAIDCWAPLVFSSWRCCCVVYSSWSAQSINNDADLDSSAQGLYRQAVACWNQMTAASNDWAGRKSSATRRSQRSNASLFVEQYGYLFERCRGGRHWWILVEMMTTVIVSSLSSVVPATEYLCRVRAWVVLALMCSVLVACGVARPMSTDADMTCTLVLLVAQVGVVACSVGGVGEIADLIGLSVSVTSACMALLSIGWSLVSTWRCGWNGRSQTADNGLLHELRAWDSLKPVSGNVSIGRVACDATSSEKLAFLRVLIEMICDYANEREAEMSMNRDRCH